jgi:hypothetical protein
MGGAKTFTRGWSIRCSQVGVDKQGKRHQGSGTKADKEQLGRFVDVVRVELPKVVPSLRDIQPQLDLVRALMFLIIRTTSRVLKSLKN